MRASTISCGPKLILAASACFCLPATGRADVLPFAPRLDVGELAIEEDEKSTPPLPLRLEADDDSPTHRIVIPAAVLAKLADVPLRARHSMSVSTARSVAAGIALSAAVGFGFADYAVSGTRSASLSKITNGESSTTPLVWTLGRGRARPRRWPCAGGARSGRGRCGCLRRGSGKAARARREAVHSTAAGVPSSENSSARGG